MASSARRTSSTFCKDFIDVVTQVVRDKVVDIVMFFIKSKF